MSSRTAANGSKVSDSFKGVNMDIMEELIDQIACNDLNAVEQNLKFNSGMIFLDERAKSLLKFAPTHEMVYTLINYTPSKRELPVWTQSRDSDIKEIKGKIAKSNIKFFIKDLILIWPEVCREIFSDSILFQGLSLDDENLEIYACTELLKQSDSEEMNLETFLDFSCSDDNYLVRHLYSIICGHALPIRTFWYRFHYFTLAVLFQFASVMYLYVQARHLACPSYKANFSLANLSSYFYYVFCSILILQEIFLIVIQKSRYFGDVHNLVKWVAIGVTLGSLKSSSNALMTLGIMLIWVNVFLSLRDSQIYGKYILMVISVVNTFVKVALLFALLLFCFTCSSMFLFYPSAAQTALEKHIKNDTTLQTLCNKTLSNDESGARQRLEKNFDPDFEEQFAAKEFLSHINDAIGNNQISQTTVNGQSFATNDLSPIRTIAWLVLSACVTIVFMNLMIGLTVGDVEQCSNEANKSLLQLQFKGIFIYYSLKKFFRMVCCRISACCPENYKFNALESYFVIEVYAKPKSRLGRLIQSKFQDHLDHPLSKSALKKVVKEFVQAEN